MHLPTALTTLLCLAIALPVAAQETRAYGTLSFTRNDANNVWSYDAATVGMIITHASGLFAHAGGGTVNRHESGYSSSNTETYGLGYHDEKYGRVSYSHDYQETSRTQGGDSFFFICGNRTHRYAADYYAQSVTFSINHSRSSTVDCYGYNHINDSTLYIARWYPSDNLSIEGGVQEEEATFLTTRSFHVSAKNRWQTGHGSVELLGTLAQNRWKISYLSMEPLGSLVQGTKHYRLDMWGIGVSFRPGDNKSMLSAHRSIFDAAPVFSINHLENSNGYRNSSFSISYSF